MSTRSNETSAVDREKNNVLCYDDDHLDFVTQNELLRIENNALRKKYEAREKRDNAVDGDQMTKSFGTLAEYVKKEVREILSDDLAFPRHDSLNVNKLRSLLRDEIDLIDDHMACKKRKMLADTELAIAKGTKRKVGVFGEDD
jgi:hypothetical protein